MGLARKETSFERRMKEVEKEAEAVSHHIRSLSKSVQKLDQRADAAGVAQQTQREVMRHSAPVRAPALSAHAGAQQTESGAWRGEGGDATETATPGKPARGDERFVSYFSSGSFGKARPLSQERRLQRNKAIMMIVFVIIVAFILYRAIF
jgi:hypothetical protein